MAVDDYGSPAYTPAELAGSSERARIAADKVFAAGLEIGPIREDELGGSQCEIVRTRAGPAVLTLPAGGVTMRAEGGDAEVRLRRYASQSFPVSVGSLRDRRPALLEIPADRSTTPWQVELSGAGTVAVCEP